MSESALSSALRAYAGPMKKVLVFVSFVGVLMVPGFANAASFKNCTALNKKYPSGVAKSAQAATKQKQVPKVSLAIYKANIKMDRDKDGTVCEK
jgi:hypothetical protein